MLLRVRAVIFEALQDKPHAGRYRRHELLCGNNDNMKSSPPPHMS